MATFNKRAGSGGTSRFDEFRVFIWTVSGEALLGAAFKGVRLLRGLSAAETEIPLTAAQLRSTPGVATISSDLSPAAGRWLDPGVPTPIPAQVGDALAGQTFNSFNDLRSAVWEQIGGNPELNSGFSRANLAQMNAGQCAVRA